MNKKLYSKIMATILLCTICAYTAPVFAYTKDETVYSKLDTSGKNYKTMVSSHINNLEEADMIDDISDLLNIENTNGDETFSQDGNSLIWKANKKDIYYQGESQKELPIECHIQYILEGNEIPANELAGKSGKVKIIIEYKNKEQHVVNINGKDEIMYTPFVALTGTVLKNDKNKNITVSNGKVINDGTKSMVMGIAMPGLQESLNIDRETLDIPSTIEISMDTTDFEASNMITFITPKVFEESDLDIFNQLDKMYDKVKTLENSANQIQEGATTLTKGTNTLALGVNELKNGTNSAYKGVKQIKDEVEKATKALSAENGETLDVNTLNTIGNQAQKSANLSNEQKSAIGNQAKSTAIATIKEQKQAIGLQAEKQAKQEIQSQKQTIGTQAANQAKQTMDSQKAQIGNQAANQVSGITLTTEQKNAIKASVKANLETNATYKSLPTEQQAMILQFSQNSAISSSETIMKQTAKTVASQTAQNTATQIASQVANTTAQSVAEQVAGQVANTTAQSVAEQVAGQVSDTTAQNVAQSTATQVAKTSATSTAKQVANQVKQTAQKQVSSQMHTLGEGLNQLTGGLSDLDNGATSLQNGANELNNGANTLAEGIQTFNKEGIRKICDFINGDVKDITQRIEKLTDLAKEYNHFTMINGENEGNVKFIMITDAIKKQQNSEISKEEIVLNENEKSNH